MAQNDLYEDLIRYYEFQISSMPRRQEFMESLQETFPESDPEFFLQLPYLGFVSENKFLQKLAKKGISPSSFQDALMQPPPGNLLLFRGAGPAGFESATCG